MLQALILAGGLGTRLRSVVSDKPKPMANVGDRPFLEYQLRALKASGVDEVILAVGYLAEAVSEYFGTGDQFGLAIRYSVERELLGTAGAIKNAAEFLGKKPFLVLNGDTLLAELDYGAVVRGHRDAVATLVSVAPPDAGAYGVLELDAAGERVIGFREKGPLPAGPAWISAGVYVLDPVVLEFVPPAQRVSIEVETFPALLAAQRVIRTHRYDGFFGDMGTPEGLERVSEYLAHKGR